jgi:hypothetical protein
MSTKNFDSWRAYVEDGNRAFCEHEMAILKRFVKRATSKLRGWPDHRVQDRPTAIALWVSYLEKRQTLAQASERVRSLEKFKVDQAAAVLLAARKKLSEQFYKDKKMQAYIRSQTKSNERLKTLDYSKPRAPKMKREGPMRPNPQGKITSKFSVKKPARQALHKPVHIAAMIVDDIPISGHFMAKVTIPQRATGALRQDPKLRKYIVREESPLRQSVSRLYMSDVQGELELLKQQIAEFESKNLTFLPRHRLPDAPMSGFVYEDEIPQTRG